MNFRHAAALALAVWYLMVPPHRTCANCSNYFQPEQEGLPLPKWQHTRQFDTRVKCETSLRWFQNKNRRKLFKRARVSYIGRYGQCVTSDDPRLKR
jgi:hypothetical protein